jgi:hypothetical protein
MIPSDVHFYSLMDTAIIAYGSPPLFGRFASHQPPFSTVISNVVLELPGILELESSRPASSLNQEKRPLEWGGTEPGVRTLSGETWHERA